MKIVRIAIVAFIPFSSVAADSSLSDLKREWRACATDADCGVVHVNGCPWDSIPVATKYTAEVRDWARLENMRHNCAREAVSDELKRKMRAVCARGVCEFESLSKLAF